MLEATEFTFWGCSDGMCLMRATAENMCPQQDKEAKKTNMIITEKCGGFILIDE